MKKLLIIIGVLVLMTALVPTAVLAATDAKDVTCTVTAKLVSITVLDGSVAYGVLEVGSTKSTLAGELADTQTVTNTGNVAVDLDIKSSNASGGTGWTLAESSGPNAFVHQFSINSGDNWTNLTTSYQTLATGIAYAGTQTFDLQITMPTESDNAEKTITVSVLATGA
jgi:hypothetical protein